MTTEERAGSVRRSVTEDCSLGLPMAISLFLVGIAFVPDGFVPDGDGVDPHHVRSSLSLYSRQGCSLGGVSCVFPARGDHGALVVASWNSDNGEFPRTSEISPARGRACSVDADV